MGTWFYFRAFLHSFFLISIKFAFADSQISLLKHTTSEKHASRAKRVAAPP